MDTRIPEGAHVAFVGEDNALALELVKGGHRQPGESMLEGLVVRELVEK